MLKDPKHFQERSTSKDLVSQTYDYFQKLNEFGSENNSRLLMSVVFLN